MEPIACFENIHEKIIEELNDAKKSILIAVAWLTDEELFDVLCEKAKHGTKVELIIIDDEINNNCGIDFDLLNQANGRIWKIGNSLVSKKLMHHKFCIIDDNIIINGSYNWTFKARYNDESITINYSVPELANQFNKKFFAIVNKYEKYKIEKELINNQAKIIDIFYKNQELFYKLLMREYPLSENTLFKYKDILDWGILCNNRSLNWSIQLIDKFKDYWDWKQLSCQEFLPWSEFFFMRYIKKWDKDNISINPSLPWSVEFFKKYFYFWNTSILYNSSLPCSIEFIELFGDKWKLSSIDSKSLNSYIWSEKIIDKYKAKFNWSELSGNHSLPWTIDLFQKYINYWDWKELSKNSGLPWSDDFIQQYMDKWDWKELSENSGLPWSIDFIQQYMNKWDWKELSKNSALSWSTDFIKKNINQLDWIGLSENPKLPWSINFYNEFADKWNWKSLSKNESFPWTTKIIEEKKEELDWYRLMRNNSFPWTFEILGEINELLLKQYMSSAYFDLLTIIELHFTNPIIMWHKAIEPFLDDELVDKLLSNISKTGVKDFIFPLKTKS